MSAHRLDWKSSARTEREWEEKEVQVRLEVSPSDISALRSITYLEIRLSSHTGNFSKIT